MRSPSFLLIPLVICVFSFSLKIVWSDYDRTVLTTTHTVGKEYCKTPQHYNRMQNWIGTKKIQEKIRTIFQSYIAYTPSKSYLQKRIKSFIQILSNALQPGQTPFTFRPWNTKNYRPLINLFCSFPDPETEIDFIRYSQLNPKPKINWLQYQYLRIWFSRLSVQQFFYSVKQNVSTTQFFQLFPALAAAIHLFQVRNNNPILPNYWSLLLKNYQQDIDIPAVIIRFIQKNKLPDLLLKYENFVTKTNNQIFVPLFGLGLISIFSFFILGNWLLHHQQPRPNS